MCRKTLLPLFDFHFTLRFLSHAHCLTSRSASHFTLPFSFHALLFISRSSSHFTLRFSFHALFSFYVPLRISPPPLLISRSSSHFTLHFSFHAPLLISRPLLILRSASHFTPPPFSHFTLPFSFYAPRLISRPSTDFMFFPRPEYMERASPFDENICSSNVVLCVL